MAIKAGQIIHDSYGFVIDRIQTGGASGLNIPEEKIYEVGNFNAVATIRDTPDLTFGMESFDVSTEIEALLSAVDPTAVVAGTEFDLARSVPMDIISPIKNAWNTYAASRGIIIPFLTHESAAYRFDLRGNSTQNHTLRGDSYFFVDGSPYYQQENGDGATTAFAFDNAPAIPYNFEGRQHFALGARVVYADRTYRRLFLGTDYTNTAAGITLLDPAIAPVGSTIHLVYASAATTVTYPQAVHAGTGVKPAALRGRSIDVYVDGARWSSVQSAEANWNVDLDRDEEFGNPFAVAQDHDVPDANGNVVVRPRDTNELWDKVYQVANVPRGEVTGPLTSQPLPLEIRLSHPDTGVRLKTFYVPDARFRIPNIESRVQEKQNPTFEWTSDSGTLLIYDGAR